MSNQSLLLLSLIFATGLHVHQAPADQSKVDPRLTDGGVAFVRMVNQKFDSAVAFPKFCKNATGSRSAVKASVLRDLKTLADNSWEKVGPVVNRLLADGAISDIRRCWLVNGFVVDANRASLQMLSDRDDVSYIYRISAAEKASNSQSAWTPPELSSNLDEEPFSGQASIPWNVKDIGAYDCWTQEHVTGSGVIVAIADDGIFATPSLTAALWTNSNEHANGRDDDGNGYVDDIHGYRFRSGTGDIFNEEDGPMHGTACAGIIAGRPSGRRHISTGVAPSARIMPLVDGGLLLRLEYALENGADIFSMSFSMKGASQQLRGLYRTALEHATAAGLVCVGGAGNYRESNPAGKQIFLPKDVPCVICAGGVMRDRTLASFSSEGPVTWSDVKFYGDYPQSSPLIKPDIVAFPAGYPAWSTAAAVKKRRRSKVIQRLDDGAVLVIGLRGNSFSGPHVAGVAALMLSANPDLNPWQVKQILEETALDLGPEGRDESFGSGLVDTLKAVRAAKATSAM